jgi:cellobiose phosphorylase
VLPPDLLFFNGLGGFTRDGREYIMILDQGSSTPLPWVNVLANPGFGTVISESGGAYTWAGNSHECRLTTWYNDPVSDPSGEAFYLRDEETGRYWSPTPAPTRGVGRYLVRHGFGYSAFVHEEDGIACEMMVYVAIDAPVKLVSFTLRNRSQRRRRLSLTGYWEWVLGEQRQQSAMHVVAEVDHVSGMLTARNPYHPESASTIAFADVSERTSSFTCDRAEFLGRNGSMAAPAGLARQRLSGCGGAGLDPCAVLQAGFELADDEVREIVFVVGAAKSIEQARELTYRFCAVEGARRALEQVWGHWNHTLGAVHVETPDPTVDILVNGWLVYQTIACRMWGRTGFYQSGGAYGFRDQLQDSMALLQVAPGLLREHVLRAAAHQFHEGDVQHWWHPPGGRGVRTHFSDDYLWLPCAVARYCLATGDTGVLDEQVPFIAGRELRADEEAYFDKPVQGASGTLYEHCTRAVLRSLRWGEHGLPLMGCGDWNDGMNRVGAGGRGESVWLAFFLHDVLLRFAQVADARGDAAFAEQCRSEASGLQQRIEANAWDGAWYRRAYFDDGTPLGSAQNAECQIDSLPQSWAVLSGAGSAERVHGAMAEVDRRLVSRSERLIRLFAPPFDRSELDPGYIRGYVPGVRENGGQYTHAAIWTAMAFAKLGDGERAWELWSLINPIASTSAPQALATYQAEPYVMAADVYGLAPHVGRGGWTWYTGSAGWMYRLATESLLGLVLEPGRLRLAPQLPAAWPRFTVHYRHRETHYRIVVERRGSMPAGVELDGIPLSDPWLPLSDDRRNHEVLVRV